MGFIEQKVENIPEWVPEYYKDYLLSLKTIKKNDLLKDFRDELSFSYRKALENFNIKDVVFTTKYQDILGMSSRSDKWSSCQYILPGSRYIKTHALGVLGSCQSTAIGMIYLTDRIQFFDVGETICHRSLVYLGDNEDNHILVLPRIYPREHKHNALIQKIFSEYLKKHLSFDVFPEFQLDYCLNDDISRFAHKPYFDILVTYNVDKELILKQFEDKNYSNFINARYSWKEYPYLVEQVIKYCPNQIVNIDKRMPLDQFEESLLKLMEYSPSNISKLRLLRQTNPKLHAKLVDIAFSHDNEIVYSFDFEEKNVYRNYLIRAVKTNPDYIDFIPRSFIEFEQLAKHSIINYPESIKRISWRSDNFPELALLAAKLGAGMSAIQSIHNYPNVFKYLPQYVSIVIEAIKNSTNGEFYPSRRLGKHTVEQYSYIYDIRSNDDTVHAGTDQQDDNGGFGYSRCCPSRFGILKRCSQSLHDRINESQSKRGSI